MAETVSEVVQQPENSPEDAKNATKPVARPGFGGKQENAGRKRNDGTPKSNEGQTIEEGNVFWAMVDEIPKEGWGAVYQIHLYRCEPYTDRKITGNHLFIMKYAEPISEQKVMEHYGSGKYKVWLTAQPPTGKAQVLGVYYFTILNMDYPPKLPLGEWLNDSRNAAWAWAKPYIEEAERKRLSDLQSSGTSQTMDQATQMFNAAVTAVKTLAPDQSPDQQHTLAAQVIATMEKNADRLLAMNNPTQFMGLVKDIIAASASKGDGNAALLQIFQAQLDAAEKRAQSANEFNQKLLEKLNDRPAAPTLKDQIQDLVLLKEGLGGIFGKRSSAESSSGGISWPEVGLEIGKKLLDVGQIIAQGIAQKSTQPGKRPQPPATVTVNPQPTLPPPAETPNQNQQLTPEQQEVFNKLEMINNAFGPQLDMIAPNLVDMFLHESGYVFRDWLIDRQGTNGYQMVSQLDDQTILGLIELRRQVAPDMAKSYYQQLTPPEEVVKFLAEFRSDEDPPEDDQGDDPEPDEPDPPMKPAPKGF